jgi:MFS family permease
MALRATFRSLKYRNYRLFFTGQSISLIGTWMQRIATPWLVYEMTKSVFLLGLVGFIGQIPIFFIAPFAGVFTDRWNRYYILVVTQVLAMMQAAVLTWLILAESIETWHVMLLAGFLGCVNAFDIPARQSFIIQLVDKKEDLSNAIALNSSMVNGARLLGPSVAGMLIAATGVGMCFLLNALSYIFVIWSLLLMKVGRKGNVKERKSVLIELQEGVVYTFGFAPIRYVILLLTLASLMGMPYIVLMPVFAKEILLGGASTFGFLMGASGLGALSGAFYLASRKSVIGLEKIIPLAAGCFGIGLIFLSLSRFFALSLALMVVTGFGMMLLMAASNTVIQNVVKDTMRGRVMSFFTMAIMGTTPFGSLLAGSVARHIGAPKTILIGGIFCVFGALLFRSKLRAITGAITPNRQELVILPGNKKRRSL